MEYGKLKETLVEIHHGDRKANTEAKTDFIKAVTEKAKQYYKKKIGVEMNVQQRDFDKEAASWDANPGRVKLAADVAHAISQQITLSPGMDVLDFGCGTGLLTMHMASLVKSVTGIDSSRGMLDMLRAKAAAQHLANVSTLQLNPDRGDPLSGRYDLIVSNMTFHHVERIDPLLEQLYGVLRSSGYLCVADLDPDQGQFHDDNSGVFHSGFERATLRRSLMQAGFSGIRDVTATEFEKPMRNGGIRRFSVFLMVGQKVETMCPPSCIQG